MAELTAMQNIGKEMARKLAAVGIDTPEQLARAGAEEVFFRMKTVFAWCICTPWRGPSRASSSTASPRTGNGN